MVGPRSVETRCGRLPCRNKLREDRADRPPEVGEKTDDCLAEELDQQRTRLRVDVRQRNLDYRSILVNVRDHHSTPLPEEIVGVANYCVQDSARGASQAKFLLRFPEKVSCGLRACCGTSLLVRASPGRDVAGEAGVATLSWSSCHASATGAARPTLGRIFASRSAEPTARALTWLMNPSRAPGIPMAPGRLDHTIVPAKDKIASAGFFAEIFGLTVKPGQGYFAQVQVNDSLTFDFADEPEPWGGPGFDPRTGQSHHYAFHVSDAEFDAIFTRVKAKGIPYGSAPHSHTDAQINTRRDGRGV